MTIHEVLACYPEALEQGLVPDWPELMKANPALAEEFASLRTSLTNCARKDPTEPAHFQQGRVQSAE
jgi:hypothetical protein